MFGHRYPAWALATLVSGFGLAGMAQQQARQYTKEDYARAEKFMPYNVAPLAYTGVVHAKWLDDGRFWYRDYVSDGWDFVIVDPSHQTRVPAFDQAKLAAALNAASGGRVKDDARHLTVSDLSFPKPDTEGKADLLVTLGARQFRCDLGGAGVCTPVKVFGPPPELPKVDEAPKIPLPLSPDKKKVAFIRDWNLWTRDVATGEETQLTTDGLKDYGYATDNAGWKQSDNPILVWSPDSRKIATFQQDQRKVGEMYLVPVTNGHPKLKAWKYPLVGDANVTMIERVIIDLDSRKVIRLKMPPDQHRSTLCDDLACRGITWEDVAVESRQ